MLVSKKIFGGLHVLGGAIQTPFYGGLRYDIIASGKLQAGEDLYVTGISTLDGSLTVSTTSWLKGDTTIGVTPTNTTTLTVYGLIDIPAGGYTTGLTMGKALDIDIGASTEFDINDDLFRFSDGTNLLRVDSLNGVQITGNTKISTGDFEVSDGLATVTVGAGSNIATWGGIAGMNLSFNAGAAVYQFKPAIFQVEIAGRILNINGATTPMVYNFGIEAGQTLKSGWLAGTGKRPVYADADGVLTYTGPDYNYDEALASSGSTVKTPGSDARFIVAEIVAAGAYADAIMYIDLDDIQALDQNVIVQIYAKCYFSAGGGSARMTIRDTGNNTLVTHVESSGQAHFFMELMWRKNDNVWILLRDDTVAVVP